MSATTNEVPLSRIAPVPGGRVVHHDGACIVVAAPGQWHYSAEAAFDLPDARGRSHIVDVRIEVEFGRIGIGWVSADGVSWVDRALVGRGAAATEVSLMVPADIGGRLVIENATEGGHPAVAIIEAIRVRDGDGAAPTPPDAVD